MRITRSMPNYSDTLENLKKRFETIKYDKTNNKIKELIKLELDIKSLESRIKPNTENLANTFNLTQLHMDIIEYSNNQLSHSTLKSKTTAKKCLFPEVRQPIRRCLFPELR